MKVLITGGAGFIGVNAAHRFIKEGYEVIIFDNLFRRGTDKNLAWLKGEGKFHFIKGDVRNFEELRACFLSHKDISVVLHLAAQVAVTTSVTDPREDFEINAFGTFNVCEAVRRFAPGAAFLNASTNKVYGAMEDLDIIEKKGKYLYKTGRKGISEKRPLDFHSPYGCSKGSADQYVIDYARIYGLKTVDFRQSCIYGPHQFGIEDQGWVAWFIISAVLGKTINIYGDGKQTRDILYVEDLVDVYFRAVQNIDKVGGRVYNVGGGAKNVLSLLELVSMLNGLTGKKIRCEFGDWRPGDQKTFVCDISKAKRDLNWAPRVNAKDGIKRLFEWVSENKDIF